MWWVYLCLHGSKYGNCGEGDEEESELVVKRGAEKGEEG